MSIHHATIYKKSTGEIVEVGGFSCDEDFVDMNFAVRVDAYGGAEHDVIDSPADPEVHYVYIVGETASVIERPPIPYQIDKTTITADGVDFLTISGLHNPCDVIVDDPDPLVETSTITVTGGSFEFSAEDPGLYTIQISRFPFLPMTLEITAEEVDPPP
jgi:hypothetical protein